MILVNETNQQLDYWIQTGSQADCGSLAVNGLVDLPGYDNQKNVYVGFNTSGTQSPFTIVCNNTGTGQQVEMALVVELGSGNQAATKPAGTEKNNETL
jgi:hypothetical protein